MFDLTVKDEHGQPRQAFRPNIENNISKTFDRMVGLCMGLMADDELNPTEADYFTNWIRCVAETEPIWPFPQITSEVEKINEESNNSAERILAFKELITKILGTPTEIDMDNFCDYDDFSSDLPLDNPPPTQVFLKSNEFVITGRFSYGTRIKVVETIENLGGIVKNGFPSKKTRYLVIGNHVSRDWYYSSYGRKIERAIELRTEGEQISIISEDLLIQNIDES